jgi:hypothetical protein
MSRRAAARLAWALWASSLAVAAAAVVFMALNHFDLDKLAADGAYLNDVLIAVTFPTVGALIASRRPDNTVGWIFCATGLLVAGIAFAGAYAVYVLKTNPGALPAGEVLAWYQSWAWIPAFGLIVTFLVFLFPDGRPPRWGWRWVGWLAGVGLVLATAVLALTPGDLLTEEGVRGVENPVGIAGAGGALTVVGVTGGVAVLASMVASVVSLIRRLRRSRGEERLQLKWVAYAAAVMAVLLIAGINQPSGVVLGVVQAVVIGPGLALAAGVAILKHRLYDIDVVIRRTLIYTGLTATLLAAYLGLVLLLQVVLHPLTHKSDLAIAGSTLAVAALFRPARRRIQEIVDRRFYRRKYDAARTLERFGARLRDEVDLDSLSSELRGVVAETMQPAHVSLWLRS